MIDKDKIFEELIERTGGNITIMTDDERNFAMRYALSKMTLKDFYDTSFGQTICWLFISFFFISLFLSLVS